MIVFILYTMKVIIFSNGFGVLSLITVWASGYFAILLIVIVYVINFVFMLWVHLTKVKLTWRERKYKQKKKKRVNKRLELGEEEDLKFDSLETQRYTNRPLTTPLTNRQISLFSHS